MSDKAIHEMAYSEWKKQATEDYVQAQRRAFLDGFETATRESEQFDLFRKWLETQRDIAECRYDKSGDNIHYAKYQAYVDVLVKLSEIGNRPNDSRYDS